MEHLDAFFLVYKPLAVETLLGLLVKGDISLRLKVVLFRDFLSGLAFLHDQGIMHLGIKERNLAITSWHEPRGLILDMDGAIDEKTSTDHEKGTLRYLAPEIVSLKIAEGGTVGPFNNKVDIWAMGLAGWALHKMRSFPAWKTFLAVDEQNEQPYDLVTLAAFNKFRAHVGSAQTDDPFPLWIEQMTRWDAERRPCASRLLTKVEESLAALPL